MYIFFVNKVYIDLYSHAIKKHTTYLIYNKYMVCAGLQQRHRMTVNPDVLWQSM